MKFISGPIINDTGDFKEKKRGSVWVDLDEYVFNFLQEESGNHIDKKFRKTIKKYEDFINTNNKSLNLYYNLRRDFKT